MELQTSSILILILITIVVLIVYGIYLVFSETNRIKKDSKSLEEKIENLDKSLTSVIQDEIKKIKDAETLSEDPEDDVWDDFEDEESENELFSVLKSKNNTFAPSFEIFGSSNEELEHLQNLQMQIQGKSDKIEELDEEPEYPEHITGDAEELVEDEHEEHEAISINIPDEEPQTKTCEKQLSHGKRKGELCNKKTFESGNFCKLHLA
jgi:FtsZ-interacting cell division protein ZipA